ncbi:SDR family oxidoreductase [Aliikangiella coralliicola]|uniref:SDR family oxidoreductase n=1 Tax=Aliikangiella coralliicola TaxID=2592383 RepID=UPI00143E0368|nr:SDR family oxidoreductase [Aliikangiella coralliicola]
MNFNGKIVWVTGASSGIGRELCLKLDQLGAKLIMSSRNIEALERVLSACANPDEHRLLAFDLTDTQASQCIVERALGFHQRIDVLFNNGGISQRSLAVNTTLEVDRKIMEVDYFGTIAITKAILPHMIDRVEGTIINIASVAGKLGSPMRSAYSGAKHALIGFMDCLRAEVASQGVNVIVVCPGFVKTSISENALTGDMSKYGKVDDEIEHGLPVERFVEILLKKLNTSKKEIIVANGLPKLGYQIRRFLPNVYHWVLPKIYKRKS